MSTAGLLLAVGGIGGGFLVATSLRVPPAIWNGPTAAALPLIAAHGRVWRTANAGFVLATVLTAAGMWLLPAEVGATAALPAFVYMPTTLIGIALLVATS